MSVTIDRVINSVIFTSSAAESTIYQFAIPANALGTNKTARGKLNCTLRQSSGVAQTYTLRLKFATVTVIGGATISIPASAGATDLRSIIIDYEIQALDSTASQWIVMRAEVSAVNLGAGAAGDYSVAPTLPPATVQNTSAANTTASCVLQVTIQAAAATAIQQFVRRSGYLEIV